MPAGSGSPPGWQPPFCWRAAQFGARAVVATLARLRVSGDVPVQLAAGPLILAANHISPFDPVALTAACHTRRLAPRFLATGGLFEAPVVGPVMRRWGHLPVYRGRPTVTHAYAAAAAALAEGAVLVVYPEGGIGLAPDMWPVAGRTGAARLALATGAPVVPVAQWGAHEVVPYSAPRGLLRALPGTIRRRPVVRVHFGTPVELTGVRPDTPGAARRATDRILAAITAELAPLRADEPDWPRHHDPSRPVRPVRSRRDPSPPEVRP